MAILIRTYLVNFGIAAVSSSIHRSGWRNVWCCGPLLLVNPPPNLSCRYFTHSTETILWAAKSEKSKHVFNYQEMRKVSGKQTKTVRRARKNSPKKTEERQNSQN